MTDGNIKHFGIIGMKWGVRRAKTAAKLTKISKKLAKKNEKAKKKLGKSEEKFEKYKKLAGKNVRSSIGIGLLSRYTGGTPQGQAYMRRAVKRVDTYSKIAITEKKKISNYKKQIIKNGILSDTLKKKMSELTLTKKKAVKKK